MTRKPTDVQPSAADVQSTDVSRTGPAAGSSTRGHGLDLLVEYRRLAARVLVLQYADLPRVWEQPAVGSDDPAVVSRDCGCAGESWRFCLMPEVCLSVALLVDDSAPYRAGWSLDERRDLWAELEAFAVRLDPWIGHTPHHDVPAGR